MEGRAVEVTLDLIAISIDITHSAGMMAEESISL